MVEIIGNTVAIIARRTEVRVLLPSDRTAYVIISKDTF